MEFTFSEVKELVEIAGDIDYVREAIEHDGHGDHIRIIHEDDIDGILKEELGEDTYMLGMFNADFLSGLETLNLDYQFIKQLQEQEAYDALGELIIRTPGTLEELVEDYISSDGYGHHFNHWDGSEYQVGEYFVFNL